MSLAALVCLHLVLAPGQASAKAPDAKAPAETLRRYTAADFDEEMIAGHPDGEPLPQPAGVKWDLDKAEVKSTPRRQRLTLAGKWRFAAQPAKETETLRKQMGWLQMPAGAPSEWKTFDAQLKPTSTYGGRPVAKQRWAWAEREVHTPIEWVRNQVFLVVKGPWSDAELFVGYLPVKGQQRDGETWYEITEMLTYGGDCPVTLRLDMRQAARSSAKDAEPFIGLELLPTGPRFNGLDVRQDPEQQQLELDIDLRRPKFILNLPLRLKDIPLIVQVRLDDAATGEMVQRFDQHIGPMPEETRNVKLRVAWSKQGANPPERMRLRTRLTSTYGGNMDVGYPLEFDINKLEKVSPGATN